MTAPGLTGRPGAKAKPGETRTERQRGEAMCVRIAAGTSLRKAAKAEGLDHSNFLSLVAADADFRVLYETAREAGIEASVSGLNEEATRVMRTALKTGTGASAYVAAFGRKVAIAMWVAEKQLPKKYGPKLAIAGVKDEPLTVLLQQMGKSAMPVRDDAD